MTRPGAIERVCPLCGARYDVKAAYCQLDGAALEEHEDRFVGAVLEGRYRVEARLGEGGMGAVYRAFDDAKGRRVAIKVLHPQLSVQPEAKRRFRREARLAMALRHPNLVRVLDFGATADGAPFLVMELLEGETLAARLTPRAPLGVEETMALLRPVCRAVEAAHESGIVHRDLKPENIFLVRGAEGDEAVKVLDFGIARVLGDDETIATRTGLIFGTARYISPEGARGEATDARSDVYSLAVLTYQLLSGRLPFESSQPMTLLVAHAKEPPPELLTHETSSGVPKPLARAVMASLDKRPARRPPSAGAYLGSLEAALAGRRRASPSKRALAVGLAFVLGFLVVGAGVALERGDGGDLESQVVALLERAKRAEAEGRLEGPEGVLALTERILELAPSRLEARRMRERAVSSREDRAREARRPRGALELATSSPRIGRPVRIEVAVEPPGAARSAVVELRSGGEPRDLELELGRDGRGAVDFRPPRRGAWEARLLIEGEPIGEPLAFRVAPARRPAPPPVTTFVAPSAPATRQPVDSGGAIDWSPPP